MEFNLKKCRDCFKEAYYEVYGKQINIEPLEQFFRNSLSQQTLTYETLISVIDEKYWEFGKHLNPPPKTKIEPFLEKINSLLNEKLPENEEFVIKELVMIFHDLQFTSLILRFAHPEFYGIYSTPVIAETGVETTCAIDQYMKYLKRLREWKETYGFERVADVDHAVWSLAEKEDMGKCVEKKCENYFLYKRDPKIISDIAFSLYERKKTEEAIEKLNNAKEICDDKEPIFQTLMMIYEEIKNYSEMINEGIELINWYKEKKNYYKIPDVCEQIYKYEKVVEILEDEIEAYKHIGDKNKQIEKLITLAELYKQDGQIKKAMEVYNKIILIAPEQKEIISELKEKLEKFAEEQKSMGKGIKICLKCQRLAEEIDCIYTLLPKEKWNECELCTIWAKKYDQYKELSGRIITIVGGKESLKERYKEEIKRLGAKDCLFHNAIDNINEISSLVKKGDYGIIITSIASHAGTNKAKSEFEKEKKIFIRLHQTGIDSLVETVVNNLIPRIRNIQ